MKHLITVNERADGPGIVATPNPVVVHPGDIICWTAGKRGFSLRFAEWPTSESPESARVSDADEYCIQVGEFRNKGKASYTIAIGPDSTMPEIIFDPD